jgi:hypothetical protein
MKKIKFNTFFKKERKVFIHRLNSSFISTILFFLLESPRQKLLVNTCKHYSLFENLITLLSKLLIK